MKLIELFYRLDTWEEVKKNRFDGRDSFKTYLPDIDALGGFNSGVNIVAARPGMGVHTFLATILVNLAIHGGKVHIFTCRNMYDKWQRYLVQSLLSITHCNDQTSHKDTRLESPLFNIEILGFQNMIELNCMVERLEDVYEYDHYVVIDDLQSIRLDQDLVNPECVRIENNRIMQQLCSMNNTCHVPIIVISQLNRDLEHRGGIRGKIPQLSDLRDCDAEQYANNVYFIYRPEYYNVLTDPKTGKSVRNMMQVVLAKNDNGQTDECWIHCDFLHHRVFTSEEDEEVESTLTF